ncbi:MAG TPA: hypothetical protein VN039_01195 [Nitrospira sp.]|nr:hypothetical protein [Nitrospira sp.]
MSSLGSVASPDYSISSPGGLSGGDTGIGFTPTASGSDSFSLTGDGSGSSSLLDKLKSYLGELGSAGKTIGKVGGGLNILSGLYGLTQANKVAAAADPFAPYRSQYATQLSALEANPSSITSLPGYTAGLQAVQRAQAAQGYTGSGNAMNALAQYGQGFYNQQVQQLAALAGAGATPGAGAVPAANITSSSLGTIGLGAAALLKGA